MRANLGVATCTLLIFFAGAAGAQQRGPAQSTQSAELPERDQLNSGTVTVITAPIGGPMSIMGSDMASVLDDGDKLRVLPILGKGSVQNLIDILRLKNIDMGFVTADALEFAKSEYNIPDIQKRVRYITRLFHNDIHIVARQEIKSLQDLQGKKIFAERSIGLPAARIVFRRLGIEADIDSQTDPDGGLQKLLSGQRDAWVASVSKGAPVIKNIKNDEGKFHLLEIPYAKPLQDVYLPSSFSAEEYPNLVPQGTNIYALAVATVLMVYNWPPESERYRRTARFVEALFGKIGQLQQPPRHPKWKDTVLSVNVAGLERFKPAQEWLDKNVQAAAPQPGLVAPSQDEFRTLLTRKSGREGISEQDAVKAYNDFLRWRAGQK
jgi:uncharacterized protein